MRRQLAAGLAAVALTAAGCAGSGSARSVEIDIRHSAFSVDVVDARVGRPLRVLLRNTDPIDHEWIVGDEATHDRHANGTEPRHEERPTEVSIDALTQEITTVEFAEAGDYRFVCHLPGHEAYGMTGVIRVR